MDDKLDGSYFGEYSFTPFSPQDSGGPITKGGPASLRVAGGRMALALGVQGRIEATIADNGTAFAGAYHFTTTGGGFGQSPVKGNVSRSGFLVKVRFVVFHTADEKSGNRYAVTLQ